MSKARKILLLFLLLVLLAVATIILSLPHILRIGIPFIVESRTGYLAQIENIHYSVSKPEIDLSSILLRKKETEEPVGGIQKIHITGKWGNPFKNHFLTLHSLEISGATGELGSSSARAKGVFPLETLLKALLSFSQATIEAGGVTVHTQTALIVVNSLSLRLAPSENAAFVRTVAGSASLSLSGGPDNSKQWKAGGRLGLEGGIVKAEQVLDVPDLKPTATPGRLYLKGILRADQVFVQSTRVKARSAAGEFAFIGDDSAIQIQKADLAIPGLALPSVRPSEFKDVAVHGKALLDVAAKNMTKGSATLSLGRHGPYSITISSVFPLSLNLKARQLSLPEILKEIEPSMRLAGWRIEGLLNLSIRFQENQELAGTMGLENFAISDSLSRYAGEKIGGELILKAPLKGLVLKKNLSVTSRFDQGEALLEGFYINLQKNPLRLSLNTRLSEAGIRVEQGSLAISSDIDLRFHSTSERLLPLHTSGEMNDLGSLFKSFVQESWGSAYPTLKKTEVAGKASWELEAGAEAISGDIRLERFSLTLGSTLSLKNLKLALPVAAPLKKTTRLPAPPQKGRLYIEALETDRFLVQDQEAAIELKEDGYVFGPFRFSFGKGMGMIHRMTVHKPFTSTPGIAMEVSLKDVQLKPLNLLPPPYDLAGTLNGDNISLFVDSQEMQGRGRITAKVFGGHAVLGNFGMENPFSSFRKLRCDLDFQGLDLELLTKALSFGRITGKINGHIHGLVVSSGQPEAFSLTIESAVEKGSAGTVSFSAVNDIQLLSSGTEAKTALPLGLDKFVGELPYKKLGIRCVLKNDVFRINGTIHEGGKEYFIRKAGLSGINVVNMNPDNRIGFKDMVERIKRVAEKREAEIK
jgi:hypothetical protein